MKKMFVMGIVLSLLIGLTACGGGGLSGSTWDSPNGITIKFGGSSYTMTMAALGVEDKGKYTLEGNTITFTSDGTTSKSTINENSFVLDGVRFTKK